MVRKVARSKEERVLYIRPLTNMFSDFDLLLESLRSGSEPVDGRAFSFVQAHRRPPPLSPSSLAYLLQQQLHSSWTSCLFDTLGSTWVMGGWFHKLVDLQSRGPKGTSSGSIACLRREVAELLSPPTTSTLTSSLDTFLSISHFPYHQLVSSYEGLASLPRTHWSSA